MTGQEYLGGDEVENYQLSSLVLDMNYGNVWNIINDLKAQKISNKNCNINSEKFKMIPELFKKIKNTQSSGYNERTSQIESVNNVFNTIYKHKLDYSHHVKDVKIEYNDNKEDDNFGLVTFKNVKFFKIEDISRKSWFSYDIPNVKINKVELKEKSFVQNTNFSFELELMNVLEKDIIPKFDGLYTILNFGTYNPSFKQYFGEIIKGCSDYFNEESNIYNYKLLVSKYLNHYKEKDENDYRSMSIVQPYASTKLRLVNQFKYGYSWPFEDPSDAFQFFTKFILEDLQTCMEQYDDPTARTFISNKFYESLESRLHGISLNNQGHEEVENLRKYLRFLRSCEKFKRNVAFKSDQLNVYDPILDFVYCLWGHISSIIPSYLRLANCCPGSNNKKQSLIEYIGHNLSSRNDHVENINGFKRLLTIALSHFPSPEMNISMYDVVSQGDLMLYEENLLNYDFKDVPNYATSIRKLQNSSFTEKYKVNYQIAFEAMFKLKGTHVKDYFEKFSEDINKILRCYCELQFETKKGEITHLEHTNQILAKREFSSIHFENKIKNDGDKNYWQYFNKNESELKHIQYLLFASFEKFKQEIYAEDYEFDKDEYNMKTLILSVLGASKKMMTNLTSLMLENNVLILPIAEHHAANIFKENRIALESPELRPYFYKMVAYEFYNNEGFGFDSLKDKIISIILSLADPFGRPLGQAEKIMSIDYLTDLMIGFISRIISGNIELNSAERKQQKIKIAALFANLIKCSFEQLNMEKLDYRWLDIDEENTWIDKTDEMFDFKYTTRSIELAYNANILMTYGIWKLTKDLSVGSFTPAAELFAWAWSSCNLQLQVYLKIDQIEEALGSKTSFLLVESKPWSPYLLKTLTMLTSGWRYVLATILNQKWDDVSIQHEFHHLSFNQFMSPANRKFSSGALSSTSIELLENTLNVMLKHHFIDFNKKDELALQKKFSDNSLTSLYDDAGSVKINKDDFFHNKNKGKSYFEKIEISPDDDLDDDVQYVFRDFFIEEDYYFPYERNVFVDPKIANKKYYFDYRDYEINSNLSDSDVEEDSEEEEYGIDNKNKVFFVCNTVSASEEFLYRTEIARCSCSVTKAFIKKREHLDLSKQVDPTQDSLIFVDNSSEFCPSELLSLFSSFITYPYLTDNKYNFDTFFPFKPITDINFRRFIERFLSLDSLKTHEKMNMVSETASINFHFNDVFDRGVVFSEDELGSSNIVKSISTIDDDKTNFESSTYKSVTNELNKFSTRKGFFEQDIDEVKACFNLRGELLQMLLKMDNTLFKYMEKDYYFVERLLDELLMDKFYMCWINCLFTLMKANTEEEFYNDRYFCLYIFKLISRTVGPADDDSMFDDCFLIKKQTKFDHLKKSFVENTVLPDMDHAFFYFSFLVERTANFISKVGNDVSEKIVELVTFYTEFFVNQLQGLYFCLLSVSQCGFDLPKSKEFFNVSCLNNKFLLHLSEQGCIGGFPYNPKDLNAVKDFFRTTDYIIRCVSWLNNKSTENYKKFDKMRESLVFLIMEFSYYFEEDKRDLKVEISSKFNEMVYDSLFDFDKYQLGTFMYTKARENEILNKPIWKRDDYFPVDVFKVYDMFYESSKHFSNMNMNKLIQNGMAFKHSVDHGLDLSEKTQNEATILNQIDSNSIVNGFIYKKDVLKI
ncbi:hypothetical protein QEN19_000150 [Hanseniaspora menglaensis]